MNKIVDKNYWASYFKTPYGPTDEDVKLFIQNKIPGKTLLLGCYYMIVK